MPIRPPRLFINKVTLPVISQDWKRRPVGNGNDTSVVTGAIFNFLLHAGYFVDVVSLFGHGILRSGDFDVTCAAARAQTAAAIV